MRVSSGTAVVAVALLSGCPGSQTVLCDNGVLCPEGKTCTENLVSQCGTAEEVAACAAAAEDYVACEGQVGTCRNKVCEPCTIDRAGCPTSGFQAMTKPGDDDLYGVWVGARDLAFAVGAGGVTWRYDGWEWHTEPAAPLPSDAKLTSVWGTDEANVYAVSDTGRVFAWMGSNWLEVATEISIPVGLTSICGDSDRVIAVGLDGTIVERAGSTWSIGNPVTSNLSSVTLTGTETYVAGGYGLVLRRTTTGWDPLRMANGTESDLTGIWASSATDIVVTGVNRTLLEGPSSMWPQITAASSLAAGTGLQAVWGDSSVVFAIGDNNAVLQRKDGGWTQLATGTLPPNAQLKAVYGADGVVIVVGLGGTVWRYAP